MLAQVRGFTLRLPFTGPPLTMNQLRSKTHWNIQRKAHAEVRDAVLVLCKAQRVERMTRKVVVQLTWHAQHKRRRDPDCLGAMVKGALDGLTAAGVLADDSSEFVDEVRLRVLIGASDPRVELMVSEVPT